MNRRALIQTVALAALTLPVGLGPAALAYASSGGDKADVFDMIMIGLPIIRQGRLINYVFVNMRLHLAKGTRPETIQVKEPLLRDALVRTAHQTPFVLPDQDREVDSRALRAAVMRHASTVIGQGAVTRVEVVSQMSRNRR